jgi:hypothetical protein
MPSHSRLGEQLGQRLGMMPDREVASSRLGK